MPPCFLVILFLSPYPLSPALVDLLASACSPALRVWGCVGGCRFATAGGGRSACLSSFPMSLSRYRSFAFSRRSAIGAVVGLRSAASLLAGFRHRLCCRVFSYSIPDEMMRITGSCDIRLVVPPLVPSGVSPLAPACLMFAAVCLDASLPSSHHLVLGCVPSLLCVPRLVSLPAPPRHRCRCLCCCRPIASRSPPRLIDTTDGATRLGCGGSLGSACLSPPRLAISSVRFGIGWRRGSMLVSLHGHHRCRLLTARSPNQISSPSCRPAASSPPSPITRHVGRGGVLFARVLWMTAAGVALLAWLSYYVCCRWGDVVAQRCVSGL